ncbi:MAG: pyridoxamine kinase [Oscillospiraceae bacterium]|nr:pyridoxamine kinase [Oscillospiraceae bacterium]
MSYKRILTVQDISCVGQCSLTIALPVLSVCGLETAVLPCSLLSNHTTGFDDYSFRDLSEDMADIGQQWTAQNIKFSAVYSGYMGNKNQLQQLKNIMENCLETDAVKILDPAMADNGRLYPGLDIEFVSEVKKLVRSSDYLLPNITEACLLTGIEYSEKYNEDYIKQLLDAMTELGCKNIVLTGVSYNSDTTGIAIYEDGRYSYYCHEKLAKSSPGTGDVFASVFTGALMTGHSMKKSAIIAADFVVECLKETEKHPGHNYGPVFEPVLVKLIEMIKN